MNANEPMAWLIRKNGERGEGGMKPEPTTGYYIKIEHGTYVLRANEPMQRFPASGLAYSGGMTKEQYTTLIKLIEAFVDAAYIINQGAKINGN